MAPMTSVVVMIPTYNEAENVRTLIPEILDLGPEYRVLVVDDASPDGTGDVVRELGRTDERAMLMARTGPKGRGYAGAEGFAEAVARGADVVVEMDADFSHQPRHIPDLVAATRDHDVVIGSRMVAGGREEGRSSVRRIITVLANAYIRTVLGVRVRDATSGFRAFTRKALTTIPLDRLKSPGPSIVQEVLFACVLAGLPIVELPIVFVDRVVGRSTFTIDVMKQSFVAVLSIRRRRAELIVARSTS